MPITETPHLDGLQLKTFEDAPTGTQLLMIFDAIAAINLKFDRQTGECKPRLDKLEARKWINLTGSSIGGAVGGAGTIIVFCKAKILAFLG